MSTSQSKEWCRAGDGVAGRPILGGSTQQAVVGEAGLGGTGRGGVWWGLHLAQQGAPQLKFVLV
ncbi:hypothetical protein E2C01_008585 [Portunus trituberculatus]|uniref:Uncharacterized protein n=1 Tax=Portunus trituberculatus TaxID=210409 RepID=A0A5B7D159_PORTR|nr:hypothetical protein [Portunus trituberculatus]